MRPPSGGVDCCRAVGSRVGCRLPLTAHSVFCLLIFVSPLRCFPWLPPPHRHQAIDDKLVELARQPNNSMCPPELSGGGGTTAHSAFAADPQLQSGAAVTVQSASSPSQAQAQAAASSSLAAAALPSEEELAKPAQD